MRQRLLVGWVALALSAGCETPTTMSGDAGVRVDSGPGSADAAAADAGPVDPVWDCSETGVDVYTPPDRLRAFDATQRGAVVRCGAGPALSVETVRMRAAERGYAGPELTSGATVTLVSYRTERASGSGGFSSGTLYLPDGGGADMPLIVHASGTTGTADDCAPSRNRFSDLERTLYVLVGSGQAVFVPDMLGLGTPGPYAWLEPVEAGRSVLDGARAALAAAPAASLSGEILVSGHSAGGHAALSAQAIQRSYAPELNVLGINGIAPVWFDTSVFGFLMTQTAYRIDTEDGWNVVYGAMYFIGHTIAYDGVDRGYEPIEASRRERVRTLFETRCLENMDGVDLRTGLAGIAGTVSELFDPTFRTSIADCAFLGDCDARAAEWQMRYAQDRPALDPMGPPVFIHLGETDLRVTPASMACPIQTMVDAGVSVSTCMYDATNHNVLAGAAAPFTVDLATALAAGSAPPACRDATAPPVCP